MNKVCGNCDNFELKVVGAGYKEGICIISGTNANYVKDNHTCVFWEVRDSYELNTNKRPPVSEVIEFLESCPDDYGVDAYEGEGGNWICVYEVKRRPD